jgi:cation transport regulator
MRYDSNEDLPMHCRINLPEAAQQVYREAWNRAWDEKRDRDHARSRAWAAVRERFEREALSGRWLPRATKLEPRTVVPSAQQRSAR